VICREIYTFWILIIPIEEVVILIRGILKVVSKPNLDYFENSIRKN
jgi:hypothetical protein